MAEMNPVAPAIGKKIRGANRQYDPFVLPRLAIGDFNRPAVPANLVTRRRAVIVPIDRQGIQENPVGVIMIVAGGVPFAPGGKRFPAKWHQDLLAPRRLAGPKPLLLNPAVVRVKPELPRPIEVQPIESFDCAALAVRPRILRTRKENLRRHAKTLEISSMHVSEC